MPSIYIQIAHYDRKYGATGTAGHRGTEQAYSYDLSGRIAHLLAEEGWDVALRKADDPVTQSDIFIALHQDGSTNTSAKGASVGYQGAASSDLAQRMKAAYQYVGWPFGFRPDNYTSALYNYYGTSRARSAGTPRAVIMEMGFATNRDDADWMWDNIHITAVALANACVIEMGGRPIGRDTETPEPPEPLGWCRVRLPRINRNVGPNQKNPPYAVQQLHLFWGQKSGDLEKFDDRLLQKIRQLQRISGIEPTGIVDKDTWAVIRHLNDLRRVCG